MPIVIACPSGHRLKVPSKFTGRKILCPVCEARIEVPAVGESSSEPVQAPPAPEPTPPEPQISAVPPIQDPDPAIRESMPLSPPPAEMTTSSPESTPLASEMAPPFAEPQEMSSAPPAETFDTAVPHQTADAETESELEPGPQSMPEREPEGFAPEPVREPEHLPPQAYDHFESPFVQDPPIPEAEHALPFEARPSLEEFYESSQTESPDAFEPFAFLQEEAIAAPELNVEILHDDNELMRHTALDPVRAKFYTVLMAAIASILVAGVCLAPSLVEQRLARYTGMRVPDVWSYIVILLALIQIGVSLYAIRIPDWSTVWMLAMVATGISAIYAAGLAMTMFSGQDHLFIRKLGLLDEVFRSRAQPWCFLVVCLTLTLAFCCGRISMQWQQAEIQATTLHLDSIE